LAPNPETLYLFFCFWCPFKKQTVFFRNSVSFFICTLGSSSHIVVASLFLLLGKPPRDEICLFLEKYRIFWHELLKVMLLRAQFYTGTEHVRSLKENREFSTAHVA
jgi:hypothetical protein